MLWIRDNQSTQLPQAFGMFGACPPRKKFPLTSSSSGPYPHRFGNREGVEFPECDGNDYVEYPLKQGEPYVNGPPGADRAVYLRDDGAFCGA